MCGLKKVARLEWRRSLVLALEQLPVGPAAGDADECPQTSIICSAAAHLNLLWNVTDHLVAGMAAPACVFSRLDSTGRHVQQTVEHMRLLALLVKGESRDPWSLLLFLTLFWLQGLRVRLSPLATTHASKGVLDLDSVAVPTLPIARIGGSVARSG